jgi:hypothetical protein
MRRLRLEDGGAGLQFAFSEFHFLWVELAAMSVRGQNRRCLNPFRASGQPETHP